MTDDMTRRCNSAALLSVVGRAVTSVTDVADMTLAFTDDRLPMSRPAMAS